MGVEGGNDGALCLSLNMDIERSVLDVGNLTLLAMGKAILGTRKGLVFRREVDINRKVAR